MYCSPYIGINGYLPASTLTMARVAMSGKPQPVTRILLNLLVVKLSSHKRLKMPSFSIMMIALTSPLMIVCIFDASHDIHR